MAKQARSGKSRTVNNAHLITGTLEIFRSGNGILTNTSSGEDIFVRDRNTGTALPGDRVSVTLYSEGPSRKGAKDTGKVVEVVERAQRDIVGTLRSTGRFLYVVPIDPIYQRDFYIPDDSGVAKGNRVLIRFVAWENKHVNPEAEIIEDLGPADLPSTDTLAVVKHFRLPSEFDPETVREAESVARLLDEPGDRMDIKDRFTITVDPKRARDFDDALSMERDDEGRRVLGVHIADVSHFVRAGGALDAEARERGTSVYLPDQVIPMLPEQLSNGVCSLQPNKDRLAFSVFITFEDDGTPSSRTFAKTIIRSNARLTYEEAMSMLRKNPAEPEGKLLHDLNGLAQQLRKARFARHALDLDMPEAEVVPGPDGTVAGIRLVINDASHQLIEECMVAANEAVAVEMINRQMPAIYRIHEPPQEERIEDLTADLETMGFTPGNLKVRKNLAGFLSSTRGHALAYHVRTAVLKSMKKALYSPDNLGHYGLATGAYLHFTSPIRRYPDLVVHRQLACLCDRRKSGGDAYRKTEVSSIAGHCSKMEQRAQEAERELVEIKKYRYLAAQLDSRKPKTYGAVVAKVMRFGMFVEVLDLQVQGLIHVSSIPGRSVRFSKTKQSLRAGKKSYKAGDRIKVMIARVVMDKRRLDFVIA